MFTSQKKEDEINNSNKQQLENMIKQYSHDLLKHYKTLKESTTQSGLKKFDKDEEYEKLIDVCSYYEENGDLPLDYDFFQTSNIGYKQKDFKWILWDGLKDLFWHRSGSESFYFSWKSIGIALQHTVVLMSISKLFTLSKFVFKISNVCFLSPILDFLKFIDIFVVSNPITKISRDISVSVVTFISQGIEIFEYLESVNPLYYISNFFQIYCWNKIFNSSVVNTFFDNIKNKLNKYFVNFVDFCGNILCYSKIERFLTL